MQYSVLWWVCWFQGVGGNELKVVEMKITLKNANTTHTMFVYVLTD